MIKFKYWELEGFGCYEKPFRFDVKSGLLVIRGENGKGKTTIFSGLTWALYKEPLKKGSSIETWPFKRTKNFNGTRVTVAFNKFGKEYKVVRCIKYKGYITENLIGQTGLYLFEDGNLSTIRDTNKIQEEIIKLIGYSFDVFVNTICFGQQMKRFIEDTGPNKNKILEEAFDASFTTKGKEIADKELKEGNLDYQTIDKKFNSKKSKLESLENSLTYINKLKSEFSIVKENKIKNLENRFSILDKEVGGKELIDIEAARTELKSKRKEFDELREARREKVSKFNLEINGLIDKINNKKTERKSTLKKIENISDTCPVCNSKLKNVKDIKDTYGRELGTINKKINSFEIEHIEKSSLLREYTDSMDDKVNSLSKKLNKYQENFDSLGETNAKIKELKTIIEELSNLKSSEFTQDNEIKLLEDEINNLKEELKVISKERFKLKMKLKSLKWISSDLFSNTGLKAFIFEENIKKVNYVIMKHYAQHIPIVPKLLIDMESGRKNTKCLIEVDGNEVKYEDLSGGQRQMVNLILVFSLNEALYDNACNIFLLDEAFEGLTQKSISLVNIMLDLKLAKGKSVTLITHLNDYINTNSELLVIE